MKFKSNTVQVHIAKKLGNDFLHLILKRGEDRNILPGIWQLITGRILPNETAIQAAKREVEEESGIVSDSLYKVPYIGKFYNAIDEIIEFIPTFGVIVENDVKVELSDEHSEFKWVTADESEEYLKIPDHRDGIIEFEKSILKNNMNQIFKIR